MNILISRTELCILAYKQYVGYGWQKVIKIKSHYSYKVDFSNLILNTSPGHQVREKSYGVEWSCDSMGNQFQARVHVFSLFFNWLILIESHIEVLHYTANFLKPVKYIIWIDLIIAVRFNSNAGNRSGWGAHYEF